MEEKKPCSKRRVWAERNMLAGYSCAQSVMLAYSDVTGLTKEQTVKLMSSFGGGMGGLREVCGAVSAAFAVLGLLTGYDDPADREGKARQYREIQALAGAFTAENDSIICRELLSGEDARVNRDPYPRTPDYYASRPCVKLVGDAAELLETHLREKGVLPDDTGCLGDEITPKNL